MERGHIDLNSLHATIRSMCGQYRELWTANKSVEVVEFVYVPVKLSHDVFVRSFMVF